MSTQQALASPPVLPTPHAPTPADAQPRANLDGSDDTEHTAGSGGASAPTDAPQTIMSRRGHTRRALSIIADDDSVAASRTMSAPNEPRLERGSPAARSRRSGAAGLTPLAGYDAHRGRASGHGVRAARSQAAGIPPRSMTDPPHTLAIDGGAAAHGRPQPRVFTSPGEHGGRGEVWAIHIANNTGGSLSVNGNGGQISGPTTMAVIRGHTVPPQLPLRLTLTAHGVAHLGRSMRHVVRMSFMPTGLHGACATVVDNAVASCARTCVHIKVYPFTDAGVRAAQTQMHMSAAVLVPGTRDHHAYARSGPGRAGDALRLYPDSDDVVGAGADVRTRPRTRTRTGIDGGTRPGTSAHASAWSGGGSARQVVAHDGGGYTGHTALHVREGGGVDQGSARGAATATARRRHLSTKGTGGDGDVVVRDGTSRNSPRGGADADEEDDDGYDRGPTAAQESAALATQVYNYLVSVVLMLGLVAVVVAVVYIVFVGDLQMSLSAGMSLRRAT